MLSNYTQHLQQKFPNLFIYYIFILLFLIKGLNCQQQSPKITAECLWETPVTYDCIQYFNLDKAVDYEQTLSIIACPLLVKYYTETNKTEPIYKRALEICKISIQFSPDNEELIFALHILSNSMYQAIKFQYELFFVDPFHHQVKFNQFVNKTHFELVNYSKSIDENDLEPKTVLSNAVNLFYLLEWKKALNLLGKIQLTSEVEEEVSTYLGFLKIRLLEKDNQHTRALEVVKKYIEDRRGEVHWYFYHLKGILLMHHIKFRAAIAAFNEALDKKNPMEQHFIYTLYNVGICYQKLNQHQNAIKYYKKALFIDPNQSQILNSIAYSYEVLMKQANTLEEKEENGKIAESYYLKAIENKPYYYLPYHNYGMFKSHTGDYKIAIQMLNKSLNLNPDKDSSTKFGIFQALYKMNKDQGLKYLNDKILNSNEVPYADIGHLFHYLGQKKLSIEYFEKAIQQKINLGQVYQWKGIVEFEIDLYDDARTSFKRAIERGNTKSQVFYNLGYLEQINQNYEISLYWYKKALQKNPESPAQQRIELINKVLGKVGKKPKINSQQL